MMRLQAFNDMNRRFPWWWGYAWHRYNTRENVLLIIPFNWVVGLLRQWWLRLREGPRNRLEQSIRGRVEDESLAAYRLVYEEGRGAALRAVKRQVEPFGIHIPGEEL